MPAETLTVDPAIDPGVDPGVDPAVAQPADPQAASGTVTGLDAGTGATAPATTATATTPGTTEHVGYVVKVYPRFSETFIVTELLAREAQGERLSVFALRPTTDTRFHPEIARVQSPVHFLDRAASARDLWATVAAAQAEIPGFADRFAALLPVLATRPADDVAQAVELARWVQREGITRLHAHFASLPGQTASLAARLSGVPYSVTAHAKDIFHESVDATVLADTLAHADQVVTISAFNERFLRETHPGLQSLHLVHNGLELSRFPFRAPTAPGERLELVAVGRLVEKKGFDRLVRAAAALTRDGVDVRVRIAGSGEDEAILRRLIDDLDVADRVELLGPLSQAEVVTLLASADAFVAPCVVGADGNADGLPTVLLEAMASGLVCIGTDVTGIGEVLGVHDGAETGLLIPSDDHDALVAAIRRVDDPAFEREQVASAARRLIENRFDCRRQAATLRRLTTGEGA